jgi:hypothetical protein
MPQTHQHQHLTVDLGPYYTQLSFCMSFLAPHPRFVRPLTCHHHFCDMEIFFASSHHSRNKTTMMPVRGVIRGPFWVTRCIAIFRQGLFHCSFLFSSRRHCQSKICSVWTYQVSLQSIKRYNVCCLSAEHHML